MGWDAMNKKVTKLVNCKNRNGAFEKKVLKGVTSRIYRRNSQALEVGLKPFW